MFSQRQLFGNQYTWVTSACFFLEVHQNQLTAAITEDRFRLSALVKYTEKNRAFLNRSRTSKFICKNGEQGRFAHCAIWCDQRRSRYFKIDGAINQAILCIRPYDMSKQYLRYLLEDSKDDIINTYLQGGQGNLSAEIIKNLRVDIPDSTAQSSVVEFLSMIERRIEMSVEEYEQIQAMKRSLLQQLFI